MGLAAVDERRTGRHTSSSGSDAYSAAMSHLVASSAAQLVVVIVALATRSITVWCAAAVLVGTLGICAHASVTLSPMARGAGRRA